MALGKDFGRQTDFAEKENPEETFCRCSLVTGSITTSRLRAAAVPLCRATRVTFKPKAAHHSMHFGAPSCTVINKIKIEDKVQRCNATTNTLNPIPNRPLPVDVGSPLKQAQPI
jgi:hypothetical protein